MKIKTVIVILCAIFWVQPLMAQQDNNERALELFTAYQGGYFQVVAVSCFQLYSSTGIIASDYELGVIGGELAATALDRSRLLLSVCATTLEDVRSATPVDDKAAHAEIANLNRILYRLTEHFDALNSKFLNPTDENIARAEKALAELEYAMDEYVGPIEE